MNRGKWKNMRTGLTPGEKALFSFLFQAAGLVFLPLQSFPFSCILILPSSDGSFGISAFAESAIEEVISGMECKIKNDNGTIFINEDVMLKVAGYAALECYGIVAMSSKRATDGLVEWLGRENLAKGVQIRNADDALEVDLFIIVEYGISIAEVCKTIVDTVRYKLESMTGVTVRKVNVTVEGIRV